MFSVLLSIICVVFVFFFFKQKTAYEMRISDWSSDVCSSDLLPAPGPRTRRRNPRKLARSQPLPQYGRTARAEENRTTQSRMTSTMTANLQNLTHTTNEGAVTVDRASTACAPLR